jgi:cadmium resistance transport/sequestration family protein
MVWMHELTSAIVVGVMAFAATNIDDIVILMLFFGGMHPALQPRQIVLGQYLGFAALILASLPGFLGGLLIPKAWLGLLGLVPIAIGLRALWRSGPDEIQTVSEPVSPASGLLGAVANLLHANVYRVAAVTIANGGDNLGVYIPLFASLTLVELGVILATFCVMIGIWCFLADRLARQPPIARILQRYGQAVMPFVLIGIGVMILLESLHPD